jgi:hypothetical protein
MKKFKTLLRTILVATILLNCIAAAVNASVGNWSRAAVQLSMAVIFGCKLVILINEKD